MHVRQHVPEKVNEIGSVQPECRMNSISEHLFVLSTFEPAT